MEQEWRSAANRLSGAEQSVSSVAEARQDVAERVQFSIERRAKHLHIRMCFGETAYTFWCGDETEHTDTLSARPLERCDGGCRASAGCEHRVEEEKISFRRITGHLEIVVHGLKGFVITIQSDVSNTRGWDKPTNAFDHTKAGAQDRNQCQLFPHHLVTGHRLKRGLDGYRFEREVAGGFVRHQCRDLVDQFLEDFGWRGAVAQQRQLVLYQRVVDYAQRWKAGGGVHGAEGTIFANMKEYQAVVVRLTRHVRDDEDTLTDLLNERSRSGWEPAMMSQDGERLTVVFQRPGDIEP